MRSKYVLIGVALVILAFGVGRLSAAVGTVDSPDVPANTLSYTLEDIHNRLDSGADGAPSAFAEPVAGPGPTGHILNDIMAKAPAKDDTNGAVPGEVLTGKTYWGLRTDGTWGTQTGTAAAGNNVDGPDGSKTFNIPNGLYSGKTATANDSDLVAGNIKSAVNILGVAGTLAPGGTATAADLFNGKTAHLASDWTLDTGTLDLACNTATFDGTANQVADAYDGGGNGTDRWCMTDSGDAAAGDILQGKKAWVDGSEVTGSMTNRGAVTYTPGTSDQTVAAGYHNGSGKVEGDADLVAGNIRSGVTLFGVSGKCYRLPATGQTTSYSAGDDGAYELGCRPLVGPCYGSHGCNFNVLICPGRVLRGRGSQTWGTAR